MVNPFQLFRSRPAPPGFGAGKTVPEQSASFPSKLFFHWLSPFLNVGYSRPLQKEDLWNLPDAHLTEFVADRVENNFFSRCPPEKRPQFIPSDSADSTYENKTDDEKHPDPIQTDEPDSGSHPSTPQHDESLVKALYHTFTYRFWFAGVLKLCADTLKTTTPLLNKVILTWLAESYLFSRLTDDERTSIGLKAPKGIGYGIGLAVALFAMQEGASLMTNHYYRTSMVTGMMVRTGIVGNIIRKSLRLSGRSRADHPVGNIATMISSDCTKLETFAFMVHELWVSPIQLVLGIGLLIGTIGYSALVGLGVLILGAPFQLILVLIMYKQREKGVKVTDSRVTLTTEVLQGIRLVKFYAWEKFYGKRIGDLRTLEIRRIRISSIAIALLVGTMSILPTLGTVLTFITYALTGHDLNVAIIFTSLQLFNIIRIPLVMLPFALGGLTDTSVALKRISTFLLAEELRDPYKIDPAHPVAVDADGDFTWETVKAKEDLNDNETRKTDGMKKGKDLDASNKRAEKPKEKAKSRWKKKENQKNLNDEENAPPPTSDSVVTEQKDSEEDKPFELKNLKLSIPKGSFVAIVGTVGSGKSSILQALIGEMKKTRGKVIFGGTVAYAPQTPWIRNASLRENVVFGQTDDEDRFREIIRACSLDHDLEMLPLGEETEIGEKGINLSGGQKARVSLARTAYSPAEIVLLDDPLSAVDSYVGRAILDQCLLAGPLANRTRILVTHALHVLDRTDYIYVMDNGSIVEQGTYHELMKSGNAFSRLMEEYGSLDDTNTDASNNRQKAGKRADLDTDAIDTKKLDPGLMQIEERNTGAVTWEVYRKYLKFAGGFTWFPLILSLLILSQAASVGNNLFLGFWTANSIPGFKQGDYMAVYVAFGVAQAIFAFNEVFAFSLMGLRASLRLFKAALSAVLRSPTSFFDTTPMGRILSRFSKDQDTLDLQLALTLYQVLSIFSALFGTIALIFYTFPYLGIIFLPMAILYYAVAGYYRRSSVETKRLDSLMRSNLYESFSETLTGLATIRAYGEQDRCLKTAGRGLDMQNRANYMTVCISRWLAIRLDLFGNILVFGIGLFAAGFRHSVNPSKIGVVLSYTLSLTQVFSEMIAQFAQFEQNMNAVERVLHYIELPSEGDEITPNDPPPEWPREGRIVFRNVDLAYREGLPLVLKDISFEVNPGEKVGIVGRTGAGKSSLLQALFRMVEVQNGGIEIDGINIHEIGLDCLRGRLALVPQDTVLFLGTLRENIDPQNLRTDAELISVLRRAWLLPHDGSLDPTAEAKFRLDSIIGDEGSNFSAGEKQLLALCRALVKNSQIIILDEATSSVDVETDAKVQRTIRTEFGSSTLLCIAHRLNTIAYYDRVLVMDAGNVVEYGTVLGLFDDETSVFRALCEEANLSRQDIEKIRKE